MIQVFWLHFYRFVLLALILLVNMGRAGFSGEALLPLGYFEIFFLILSPLQMLVVGVF